MQVKIPSQLKVGRVEVDIVLRFTYKVTEKDGKRCIDWWDETNHVEFRRAMIWTPDDKADKYFSPADEWFFEMVSDQDLRAIGRELIDAYNEEEEERKEAANA